MRRSPGGVYTSLLGLSLPETWRIDVKPESPGGGGGKDRRELERVTLAGDHFVLVALPSGEERLEPLLDLGPHGVAILLRTQRADIAPGAFLPRVRFFVKGECTLQCQATVREVTQVPLEDGGFGLKVGMRLELLDSPEPSQPVVDTYSDAVIIADTVTNLVRAKATLRVHATGDNNPRGLATVEITRFSRELGELSVRITEGESTALETGATCELRGESYGTRLSLVANLTENGGVSLRFDLPTRLAVWRHRVGGRVRTLPPNLEVSFESPFTKTIRQRPLVDLSARGLAFSGAADDGLIVGMLLPTVVVSLPNGTVHARGVVRNVRPSGSTVMVGVEFVSMPDASTKVLEGFVDSNLHPQVRPASVADIQRLWPVFEKAGMFARSHAAMTPTIAKIEPVRRNLLSRARELIIHMVGGGDDTIYGTAELLRTYSATWSMQHVCVSETSQSLTADQLVVPLVEAALRRKDFDYLHALVDPERSRMGLARLRAMPPDENGIYWVERVLFNEPQRAASAVHDVQDAAPGDLDWVVERAREAVRPLERSAFDMGNASDLRLTKVQRLYGNVGIVRQRLVRMSFSPSGPNGFALVEVTTQGVSFPGYTELARLYPTRKDAPARRDALIALAHDAIRVHRENRVDRTQILVDTKDAPVLEEAGFVKVGTRIELIAGRNGASQIVNFINLLA